MKSRTLLAFGHVLLIWNLCASAQENKVLPLLEVKEEAALKQPKGFNPLLTYNAELVFDSEGWIRATFSKPDDKSGQEFAAVFFELSYAAAIPPLDDRQIPDGSGEWPNVWLGYDRFAFDYRNDGKDPIRATVLIQDFCSWVPQKYDGLKILPDKAGAPAGKQKELPQVYEEEVILNPGTGTIAIDLKKPMWCNTRDKGLGLENVKAFGICLKNSEKQNVIGVNRFRVESKDKNAGVFRYPEKVKCGKCSRGFSDVYAPFCPFCGSEMKAHKETPKELPDVSGLICLKAIDGAPLSWATAGAEDGTDRAESLRGGQHLGHYDVHYNKPKGSRAVDRKKKCWEKQACLKFGLGKEFDAKPRIKNATLWFSPGLGRLKNDTGKKEGERIFSMKPWLAGVALCSVRKEFQGWEGSKLTFMKTPPYDKLIYVSGQHPGDASAAAARQRRGTDKEEPRLLPMDITEYVQEVVASGEKTFSLVVKPFTPPGAKEDPHSNGHLLYYMGLGTEKAPFITVELEK